MVSVKEKNKTAGTPELHTMAQQSQADAFIDNLGANPLAQAGLAYTQSLFQTADPAIRQQLGGVFSFASWRYYFNVTPAAVARRLAMIFAPWAFPGAWERKVMVADDGAELYTPPAEDPHAPELYVPLLAFVTYVLAAGFLAGASGAFAPEQLSLAAAVCLVLLGAEVALVQLAAYALFGRAGDFRVALARLGGVFVPAVLVAVLTPLGWGVALCAGAALGLSYGLSVYRAVLGDLRAGDGPRRAFAGAVGLVQAGAAVLAGLGAN